MIGRIVHPKPALVPRQRLTVPDAPIETVPIETAPIETAPIETAPIETAPGPTAIETIDHGP